MATFDVLTRVVYDADPDPKVGKTALVQGLPATCIASLLENHIIAHDRCQVFLGRANRDFEMSLDADFRSLLSGEMLVPRPADTAGAAATAGCAVGSSTTYTIVYLRLFGPREPPAAAAAGGRVGSVSSAGLFHSLPDGSMPPIFYATLDSAVIGIYDRRTPVSTAVFFSPTRAITSHHDAKPNAGDILAGASNPHIAPVRKWKFTVVASSAKDDLVVLEIASGPPATLFLPLGPQRPIRTLRSNEVWLASFGISAANKAAENPEDIDLGSFSDKTHITAFGTRHFVYRANTGRGDSGGAVINMHGQLVGVHLGGWNDVSPPPSPETAAGKGGGPKAGGAAGAVAAAAAAIKNEGRIEAMGMAELDTATRKSIVKLAEQLIAGGYAIYVCSPAVAALCSTVRSSSAGAATAGAVKSGGGSGSLSGRKRHRSREDGR